MKTFNRTTLPESITYNKEIYVLAPNMGISLAEKLATARATGKKIVIVKVLSRRLRGATDLHHKPYEPTEWIFLH